MPPRFGPPRLPGLLLSVLLAGCATPWEGPRWSAPPPEVLARARRVETLLEEERVLEALEGAREGATLFPGSAEALRALQSARVAAGQDLEVRREAEAALAADPDNPLRNYLAARVEAEGARAERLLRRAVEGDPGFLWGRLALAQGCIARGALREGLQQLEAAERISPGHPWVPLLASQSAAVAEEPARAIACLREVVRRDPDGFRGQQSLAARLSRVPGGDAEARRLFAAAFGAVPGSRGVAASWRESLERDPSEGECARAVEVVDAAGADPTPAARHLRGAARLRRGDAAGALPDLRAALAAGEDRTAALDDLRLALFTLGRYAEALAAEEAATPEGLLRDPASETDGRRLSLERAVAAATARPEDPAALGDLAALCRLCGWHREAALVAKRRLDREPGSAEARADVEETGRTLRFLAALRDAWRRTYHGYDEGGSGDDLEGALAGLRALSREHLGVDLSDGLARRSYALVGEMAESVRATGPSREWFDGHGLALLVGRAAGEPVEARLLRVVSLRRDAEERSLGRRFRATVVVGEGLLVPSRREAGGTVLGGATVGDLVFLDLEGVARWSGAAFRARTDPAVRRLLEGVLRDPPGPALRDEEATRFPARIADRLALPVAEWDDPRAALADFLDAAREHELAHAADAARYLPILSHPMAGLVLLLRGRFSGAGVASVLEGDAQIASLAAARSPRAALSTLVSFLPARDAGTPHGRGYFDALEDLLEVLRERGIVPGGVLSVRTLDLCDPEAVRAAAREVCRRRGLLGR